MDENGIMIRVQMAMDGIRKQIEKVLGKPGEEGATVDGENEMVVDDSDSDSAVSRNFWEGVWDAVSQSSPDQSAKSLKEANNGRLRRYAAGGSFGVHLGFEPIFKKSPNTDNGLSSNLLREGSGEYGRLLTSYTWNMYKEMKGYAEADTAVWDKRVWNDSGSWFKAPTIKGIVEMGVSIAAMAVGAGPMVGALINLADDAVFAALDVDGGHKQWQEAGLDFGKKALSSAANLAIGGVFNGGLGTSSNFLKGGLQGVAGKSALSSALLTGAQTWTSSMASGAINAFNLTYNEDGSIGGMGWDSGSFTNSAFGLGTIAGVASSFTSSMVGASFSGLSADDRAFYRGGVSLATAASGEATRYATYLGLGALGRVGNGQDLGWDLFGDAYDSMGGLTLNVANLGSMLDFIGSVDASTNATGQSGLGTLAQRLSGAGLLELNLGRSGATMRLGSGGMDLGRSLYSLGKGAYDKSLLTKYLAQDATAGDIAWKAYVAGDWTAGNTARRLASGKDELILDLTQSAAYQNASEAERAEMLRSAKGVTEADGQGGRNIFMQDMSGLFAGEGSAWNMAITLQHEAYRDGRLGVDNASETYQAALAHTMMAKSLLDSGHDGFLDAALVNDLTAYAKGGAAFAQYVGEAYDSSKDYWKLMENGSLAYDGDGWLKDPNGNFILDDEGNRMGSAGVQTGLQAILGIGKVEAYNMLLDQGFTMLADSARPWNHDGNNSSSIKLENARYRAIYEGGLDRHNTRLIYEDLVSAGLMDVVSVNWNVGQVDQYGNWTGRQPDVEYISYEQYKENNFIQGVDYNMVELTSPSGQISSSFGIRDNPFTGLPGAQHAGVDFPMPGGTPINPLLAGIVDFIGFDNTLGNYMVMQHEMRYTFKGRERSSTFYTDYLHLQANALGQPDVTRSIGGFIPANGIAAYSGNTGAVTGLNGGYHLHTGVMFGAAESDPYSNWLRMQGNLGFTRTRGNRTGMFFDPALFW